MRSWIKILSLALVAQIALIALVQFQEERLSVYQGGDQLLTFDFSAVDRVEISQRDQDSLVLAKQDTEWILPNQSGFPASRSKLEDLESQLFEITRPWPAGSTMAAARQFEVADNNYRSKISFFSGENQLAALYFGTSPGFRKVHARLAGEEVTYSLDLHAHEITAESNPWLNRQLLRIPREDLQELRINDIALRIVDGEVELEDIPADKQLDSQRAESILRVASGINFSELIGDTEHERYFSPAEATLSYTIVTTEGNEITVAYKKEGEEDILLQSSSYPFLFKASQSQFENVQRLTKEDLLVEKEMPVADDEPEDTEEPSEVTE